MSLGVQFHFRLKEYSRIGVSPMLFLVRFIKGPVTLVCQGAALTRLAPFGLAPVW